MKLNLKFWLLSDLFLEDESLIYSFEEVENRSKILKLLKEKTNKNDGPKHTTSQELNNTTKTQMTPSVIWEKVVN
jgi:hypothetical protein